jgi:hypothetical protein
MRPEFCRDEDFRAGDTGFADPGADFFVYLVGRYIRVFFWLRISGGSLLHTSRHSLDVYNLLSKR